MYVSFLFWQSFSNLAQRNESSDLLDSLLLCPLKREHILSLSFQRHSKTILLSHKNSRTNLSNELHDAAFLWHYDAIGFPGLEIGIVL